MFFNNYSEAKGVRWSGGTTGIYVGSMEGVEASEGKHTHLHPLSTAHDHLFKAALHELDSIDAYLEATNSFAPAHPEMEGIMGSGFSGTFLMRWGPERNWSMSSIPPGPPVSSPVIFIPCG